MKTDLDLDAIEKQAAASLLAFPRCADLSCDEDLIRRLAIWAAALVTAVRERDTEIAKLREAMQRIGKLAPGYMGVGDIARQALASAPAPSSSEIK